MVTIVYILRTERLFSGTATGFFCGIFLGGRGSHTIIIVPYR